MNVLVWICLTVHLQAYRATGLLLTRETVAIWPVKGRHGIESLPENRCKNGLNTVSKCGRYPSGFV